MLDTDAERYIEAVRAAPPMNRLGVDAARAAARARKIAPVTVELHSVGNRTVDGPHGPIPIRIYKDATDARLPAVLYFHAGGWMLGDLNHSDGICRTLAKRARCIVINVEYRLAP